MAEQLRLSATYAGSGQTRLAPFIRAQNDFLGINGNAWNNQGPTGRWDQVTAWDGTLVGVSGGNLVDVLQEIDNFDLTDTNFAETDLSADADRQHDFGGHDLDIINLGTGSQSSLELDTSFRMTASHLQIVNPIATLAGEFRLLQRPDQGTDYFGLRGPAANDMTGGSYTMEFPSTVGSNGQVLAIQSGGGSGAVVMEWASAGSDTNFALNDLNADSARVHDWMGNSFRLHNASTINLEGSGALTMIGASVAIRGVAGGAGAGQLKFYEGDSDAGDHSVTFKAADSLAADTTYIWPTAYPPADRVLQSDASGTLTWVAQTGGDTNFAVNNLAADNNRDHDWMSFSFSLTNASTISFAADGAIDVTGDSFDIKHDAGGSAGRLRIYEAGSTNFFAIQAATVMAADTVYTWPAAFPPADYVLQSNSSGTLSWVAQTGGDTNWAVNNLQADDNRVHDWDSNTLTINNLGGTSSNVILGAEFQFTSDVFNVQGPVASSGVLRIQDPSNTNYVGFTVSASPATQTYTLPDALPATEGEVLSSTTGGILSWTTQPPKSIEVGIITLDTNYTAGTTINLDGSSPNMTFVGGDVITMTGITDQASLFANKRINFYLDGIQADTSGVATAHVTAQFINTTSISLDQDMPAGTSLKIERIS